MDRSLARRILARRARDRRPRRGRPGRARRSGINVPARHGGHAGRGRGCFRRRGRAPDPLDAWLPVSALVLAGFVAVRADPFVAFLDIAGAAAFTGASVAAFSGLAVTRRSATAVLAIGAWVLEAVFAGAGRALRAGRPAATEGPRQGPGLARARRARPHPGGAARADLRGAVRLGGSDLQPRLRGPAELPHRPRRPAGSGPLRAGGRVAGRRPAERRGEWPSGARDARRSGPRLDPPRSCPVGCSARRRRIVVLVAVDLIVGLFVGLQLAYLFGGLDTLAAAGMKYSDYARRGYFELVAAAALAGGILVGLEYQVARRTRVVRGPRDRPRRPDDRRARLGRAPAQALPGRLRLDRAAAVRRRLDRGDGRHAGRPGRLPRHRPHPLARARDGGHRARVADRRST